MSHLRRWVGAVVALGVLGVACAACSSSDSGRQLSAPDGSTLSTDSGTGSEAGVGATGAPTFHVAQALRGTLVVRDRPESDGAVVRTLRTTDNVSGKIVCLVADQLGDWVQVYLPVGAVGTTGWVPLAQVTLSRHAFRLQVARRAHRLTLYSGRSVVLTAPVALGPDAPPAGERLFVTELVRPPDPAGPYRAFAYGLSGAANGQADFAAGHGVVAVHGTDDPAALGRDVARGAVGVDDAVVTRMAQSIGLPLGTPVDIVR
jgi:hypothetical protein